MARRTEAYVDTSAFIAFVDRSDTYHALFRRLFADPPRLVTTPLVIAEGHGWFLKRYDRNRALQFLGLIEELREASSAPLTILAVGAEQQRDAALLLRQFSDQNLTLTDAVGLQVMETRRSEGRPLNVCWSTDFHMGLTDVPLVIYQY